LVQSDIASVRKIADNFSFLIQLVPQADNLYQLLDAVDTAIAELLLPAVDLMEAYPLSDLHVEDGYNVTILYEYIDFAEAIMPKLETLLDVMNHADLSILDSEGKIEAYLESINKLMDGLREKPDLLPMIKSMLGAQDDRLYLIAVQNPSEIRASGGFPGFMGSIRIEGGMLSIGSSWQLELYRRDNGMIMAGGIADADFGVCAGGKDRVRAGRVGGNRRVFNRRRRALLYEDAGVHAAEFRAFGARAVGLRRLCADAGTLIPCPEEKRTRTERAIRQGWLFSISENDRKGRMRSMSFALPCQDFVTMCEYFVNNPINNAKISRFIV
jgi:hypothetical protein